MICAVVVTFLYIFHAVAASSFSFRSIFIIDFERTEKLPFISAVWILRRLLPLCVVQMTNNRIWRHNAWLIFILIEFWDFEYFFYHEIPIQLKAAPVFAKREQRTAIKMQFSIEDVNRTLKCNGRDKIRNIYDYFLLSLKVVEKKIIIKLRRASEKKEQQQRREDEKWFWIWCVYRKNSQKSNSKQNERFNDVLHNTCTPCVVARGVRVRSSWTFIVLLKADGLYLHRSIFCFFSVIQFCCCYQFFIHLFSY